MMDWSKIRYFTEEEMRCPHCGQCHMNEGFMLALDVLRGKCGFPLIISSGYRCPEYNNQISHTGRTGPHTTGRAADIAVYGAHAHEVLKHALALGFTGIGINQKGEHRKRFIHLDNLIMGEGWPRPNIWTY